MVEQARRPAPRLEFRATRIANVKPVRIEIDPSSLETLIDFIEPLPTTDRALVGRYVMQQVHIYLNNLNVLRSFKTPKESRAALKRLDRSFTAIIDTIDTLSWDYEFVLDPILARELGQSEERGALLSTRLDIEKLQTAIRKTIDGYKPKGGANTLTILEQCVGALMLLFHKASGKQFSKGVKATSTNEYGWGATMSPLGQRYDYTQEKPGTGARLWCYWTGPISGQGWPSTCIYMGLSGQGVKFNGNLPQSGSYPPGKQRSYESFGNVMVWPVNHGLPYEGNHQYFLVNYGNGDLEGIPNGGEIRIDYANGYMLRTTGDFANTDKVYNGKYIIFTISNRDIGATRMSSQIKIDTPNLNHSDVNNTYLRPKNVVQTITGPDGRIWYYEFNGNGDITRVTDPDGASDYYQYDGSHRVINYNGRRGYWTYNYNFSDSSTGSGITTVTNPYGEIRQVYHLRKPGPATSVTEQGRTTSYNYDANDRLTSVYYSEGNSKIFAYDALGRVETVTEIDKSGDYSSALVSRASYNPACTHARGNCGQPRSTTDPKGNVTSYEFDSSLGLLSAVVGAETSPGLRPRTSYTYDRKPYFWVDAAGAVQSRSASVVVMTSQSQCITTTACAGTVDEIRTNYGFAANYVANSAGNNAMPVSIEKQTGDGASLGTVANTYDAIGNLILVDGMRTDVDDRRYTTYDVLRRPVFEISADPDGPGPLARTIVRHTYGAVGKEVQTDYGSGNAVDGSDFVVTRFKRMYYDGFTGLLTRTEEVVP